jgi:hypothetical protein
VALAVSNEMAAAVAPSPGSVAGAAPCVGVTSPPTSAQVTRAGVDADDGFAARETAAGQTKP